MENTVQRKIGRGIGLGVMIVIGIVAFTSIGSFVVMSLWNWLLPDLFGLPQVTLWQALGLLVLSRILFGGFGMGGRRGKGKHRRHLTPEEKEHLRQGAEPGTDAS